MSQTTPLLDLPLIQEAQAQKHVTHNEALVALDALVQPAVIDADRTAPPPAPEEGDRHLVAANAAGAWAGRDGMVALFDNGGWTFLAPRAGWRVHVTGTGAERLYDGAAWGPLRTLGVNAEADATNRLAVAAPATLLSHEGAGHRVAVNKAGPAETASLLFQSAWSGRAEMGLAGTDDFSVKVSADGAAWTTALTCEAATGAVRLTGGYGGTGSAAGAMGGQLLALTGAHGTGLAAGDTLSHGAGPAAAGPVLPFAGRVLAVTASVAGGPAGDTALEVALDGAAQAGVGVTVSHAGAGVARAVADLSAAPLAVPAGAAVTLRCAQSPGADDVVGTVLIQID